MSEEVNYHRRLDSELYGALVHATETAGTMVRAQIAAACVVDGPPASERCYVSAARLGVTRAQEESLAEWPGDPDSLFSFVQKRNVRDRSFRPRELVDELEYARLRLFRRLEGVAPVKDAICAAMDLDGDTQAIVALLRCGDHPPFPPEAINVLERFRPGLQRVIRRGFQRETQVRGFEMRHAAGQVVPKPVTAADMLAKLSKTELHVLGLLRGAATERKIADQIGRSPHTVHVHVKNIYRKLGVSSRKHLLELFGDRATSGAQ